MGIIVFLSGFEIVEVKNKRTCSSSLKEVGFFNVWRDCEVIIILVRQKGLVWAISRICPHTQHSYCNHHLEPVGCLTKVVRKIVLIAAWKDQLMVNEPIRNNGEGSVSISINEIGSKYWVGEHCLCRCYEFLAMNTAESAIMCFKVARHFESPGLCPR